MLKLKFAQKTILTLYRTFYGKNYVPDTSGNTEFHVMAQKMCYLLEHAGINAGSYNHIWDSFGPFLEGLQSDLILLDYNQDGVENFYSEQFNEDVQFADIDVEGSLFSVQDKERIHEVASLLKISEHETDCRKWVELLGSLAYLAICVMPEVGYSDLEKEILVRKKQYGFQSDEIKEAWKVLNTAQIIFQ